MTLKKDEFRLPVADPAEFADGLTGVVSHTVLYDA